MQLADSLAVRRCRVDDADAVLATISAEEELATGLRSQLGTADVLGWWSRIELPANSWLVHEDQAAVGVGWLERQGDVGIVVLVESPAHRGRGIRAELARRAEERARAVGANRLHLLALVPDDEAAQLLVAGGAHEVRRFWHMAIELHAPPEEWVLPRNLELRQVGEGDLRAYHEAMGEAFEDHWEHHQQPFEQWWESRSNSPDFDLSLWFAVYDGAQIAAAIRNEANRDGGGYIASLGVRRPWRRQGLARALLLHAFAEFWHRGVTRVTLSVDASSPTGATRLYESVGMRTELVRAVFEKALT